MMESTVQNKVVGINTQRMNDKKGERNMRRSIHTETWNAEEHM
jgi:hypothetical protein